MPEYMKPSEVVQKIAESCIDILKNADKETSDQIKIALQNAICGVLLDNDKAIISHPMQVEIFRILRELQKAFIEG